MVKLPRGISAVSAACLPNSLIFLRIAFLIVQFRLHWAFNIIAEFSPLVLYESI